MKVAYELTIEDLMAFVRFRNRKNILIRSFAYVIPPAIALLLWFWSPASITHYGLKGDVTTRIGSFWTEFTVNTIVFTGLLIWIRYAATKRFKNYYLRNTAWQGPQIMEITGEKVVFESKYRRSEVDPSMIRKIEDGKEHVFLFFDQDEAWTIPKRYLLPNVRTEMLRDALHRPSSPTN